MNVCIVVHICRVYMCAYMKCMSVVCVSVCVSGGPEQVYVSMCVCGSEVNLNIFSQVLSTFIFETESVIDLKLATQFSVPSHWAPEIILFLSP